MTQSVAMHRHLHSKVIRRKPSSPANFKKQFSRFHLCDSLLTCFSANMIEIQLSQSDKGAIKGLCLEFILHEYAKALAITKDLKNAPSEKIIESLDQLYSSAFNTSILQQPGILVKLCFYCEALVQNSKMGEHLLRVIDDLRNTIILLRSAYAHPLPPTNVHELLGSLFNSLAGFFSHLLPVFQSSLECESALFTLLELRQTLNHHLGPNTVENLLQNLFPEGPELLRKTLSHRFSRRGFRNFFQRNETLFEGLVWPEPTCIAAPKS